MIRLYRNKAKFKTDEILVDNESFFNNKVAELDDISLNVMSDIDKAVVLDREIGTIMTPYGITGIDSLSTGCKTVLNYIYLSSRRKEYSYIKAIDATECGWNAIEALFKTMEILCYDIGIIIEHDNKLYNCSDRIYLVDDAETIESMIDY